jgi:hypothetical protein
MNSAWLHGCGVCLRTYAWLTSPLRSVEAQTQRLHDIEQLGLDADAPLIALAGVVLFLLPVFLFLAGSAFGAYYLSGG